MEKYYYVKNDVDKVLYKKIKSEGDIVFLKGVYYRRIISVSKDNVICVDDTNEVIKKPKEDIYFNFNIRKDSKYLIGTVLHIDSDEEYLQKCLSLYKSVGVYCFPLLIKEKDLKESVKKIDLEFNPDVIVITGHDVFDNKDAKDINCYKNSRHYMGGVLEARKKYPNAVIIGGACQSHCEALLASGANFASSPGRINVHIYDPAILAIAICVTGSKTKVDFFKLEKYIENIAVAYGGVETNGKMKVLY